MRHRLAGSVGMSLLAVGLLAQGGPAAAAEKVTPEEEIQYRQSVMTVLGRARAQLTAMVKGDGPYDAAAAAKVAGFMNELAARTDAGFGPGTEKGAPTKADLKIWKEPAKYRKAHEAMVAAVARLQPAASRGKESLKAALNDAGKTCKGCHDEFKLVEFRN